MDRPRTPLRWQQIDKKVLDGILRNVGIAIVFRVGANDASLIAKQLGQVDPVDLINLPNYRNFVRMMINGTQSKAYSFKTIVFH